MVLMNRLNPRIELLVILSCWVTFASVSLSFTVAPTTSRTGSLSPTSSSAEKLLRRRGAIPSPSSSALSIVADADQEELSRHRRKKRGGDGNDEEGDHDVDPDADDTDDAWIPTSEGGFLPNLFGKRRSKMKEEQALVVEVTGLEDYKAVVADERERLVCVRFYAPWCRACKAIASSFRQLSYRYPDVKLVEVPLTKENTFLHQGLGVPSLPFGHIYHPEAGLVEERSLNKKYFAKFKNEVLKSYVEGSCPVDWEKEEERFSGSVMP